MQPPPALRMPPEGNKSPTLMFGKKPEVTLVGLPEALEDLVRARKSHNFLGPHNTLWT